MKSGKVQRGEECTGNLPPSQLQWDQRRLVFNQGGATNLLAPNTLTRFAEYRPPFKDPGVAVVSMYSVATVRPAPAGTRQIDPFEVYNAEEFPDFTNNPVVAQISIAGRGLGLPQFKVRFQNGDTPEAIVYVDGNSVLALPCAAVTVDALTTPLLVPATKGEVVQDAGTILGDLVTEALAAVSVSWAKGNGVAGPQGMGTGTNPDSFPPTTFCQAACDGSPDHGCGIHFVLEYTNRPASRPAWHRAGPPATTGRSGRRDVCFFPSHCGPRSGGRCNRDLGDRRSLGEDQNGSVHVFSNRCWPAFAWR